MQGGLLSSLALVFSAPLTRAPVPPDPGSGKDAPPRAPAGRAWPRRLPTSWPPGWPSRRAASTASPAGEAHQRQLAGRRFTGGDGQE